MTDFNLSLLDSKEQVQRMSSLEIAELTGKRHANVMRDIRDILAAGCDESNYSISSYKDKNNQERPCFMLTKEGTLLLVTRYNVKLRELVIDRLVYLEGLVQKQMIADMESMASEIKQLKRQLLQQQTDKRPYFNNAQTVETI